MFILVFIGLVISMITIKK
ncbi:hypothetical protein [Staphylococcus pettenkoferi]